MSKYIKVDDLQRYCDNQKDHSITPNDFQRMNFIELPDKHGRLIDADELLPQSGYDPMMFMPKYGGDHRSQYNTLMGYEILRIVEDAPTILEASNNVCYTDELYEAQSNMRDYCMRYEPTYNSEDGSM